MPARLTGRCFVAGSIVVRRVGMGARVLMRQRRGMKFPGYITAPVETGWRVVSTSASPIDRALSCSRID